MYRTAAVVQLSIFLAYGTGTGSFISYKVCAAWVFFMDGPQQRQIQEHDHLFQVVYEQ